MRPASGQDLIGKTLISITKVSNEELLFVINDGKRFKMHQGDNCAGFIMIWEITGNLNNLLGSPIVVAKRKVYSDDCLNPDEKWFLYTIGTVKESVQIKWLVSLNGCFYFRGVDFDELDEQATTPEPEKQVIIKEEIWKETLKEPPRRKKRDGI